MFADLLLWANAWAPAGSSVNLTTNTHTGSAFSGFTTIKQIPEEKENKNLAGEQMLNKNRKCSIWNFRLSVEGGRENDGEMEPIQTENRNISLGHRLTAWLQSKLQELKVSSKPPSFAEDVGLCLCEVMGVGSLMCQHQLLLLRDAKEEESCREEQQQHRGRKTTEEKVHLRHV